MDGEIEKINNFEKIIREKLERKNKPDIDKDDLFVKNALDFLSDDKCFEAPAGFRVYVSCEVIIRIWEGRSYFGAAINRNKTRETYDICLNIITTESSGVLPPLYFRRILATICLAKALGEFFNVLENVKDLRENEVIEMPDTCRTLVSEGVGLLADCDVTLDKIRLEMLHSNGYQLLYNQVGAIKKHVKAIEARRHESESDDYFLLVPFMIYSHLSVCSKAQHAIDLFNKLMALKSLGCIPPVSKKALNTTKYNLYFITLLNMISEIGFIKLRKSRVISSAELFEQIKRRASEYNLGWTLADENLERLRGSSRELRLELLRMLENKGLFISRKFLKKRVVNAIQEYFNPNTVAEASSIENRVHLVKVFYHLIYLFDVTLQYAVYRGFLRSYSCQEKRLSRIAGKGITKTKAAMHALQLKTSASKLKVSKESDRLSVRYQRRPETELETSAGESSSGTDADIESDRVLIVDNTEVQDIAAGHQLTMEDIPESAMSKLDLSASRSDVDSSEVIPSDGMTGTSSLDDT